MAKRTHKFNRVHAISLMDTMKANWQDWIVAKGMGDGELAELVNAIKIPALKDASRITPAMIRGVLKDLQTIDPEQYTRPRARHGSAATAELETRVAELEARLAAQEDRLAAVMRDLGMSVERLNLSIAPAR